MVYLYPTSQRPVRTRISEIHLTVEITKGQSQNRTSLCFCGQQRHVWTKSPSTKRLVGEKPRDTPPPRHYPTSNPLFQYSQTPHLFSSHIPHPNCPLRFRTLLYRYHRCYVYGWAWRLTATPIKCDSNPIKRYWAVRWLIYVLYICVELD